MGVESVTPFKGSSFIYQYWKLLTDHCLVITMDQHGEGACITQWSCEPCCAGNPRWSGHSGELWTNVVHWRREWQTTPVILLWEPHELYTKVKRYDTKRWAPQIRRYATGEEQRAISHRMKQLGQSGNDAHLWMCLVVKVKSDAIKNSITEETGVLGPWIKVNCTWSSRRWQE